MKLDEAHDKHLELKEEVAQVTEVYEKNLKFIELK